MVNRMKSTERFSGLASIYAISRPSYPAEAIDFIISECEISKSSVMVDVGCGTGISTMLFSNRGIRAIGIEPNDDMRKTAQNLAVQAAEEHQAQQREQPPQPQEQPQPGHRPHQAQNQPCSFIAPEFRDGTAEDTRLPDASVDVLLSAQAFHWFDADKALAEFHRVLKPGGYVVLMWNERDESDPFSKSYGDLFRELPETAKVEMRRGLAGEPLLTNEHFVDAKKTRFKNQQKLDLDGVINRAFSASYAPKEGDAALRLREGLTRSFEQHQKDGFVSMHYEVSVYTARRPR